MNASDSATLVKEAADIVEVIGRAVTLRRSGNRHVGLCPFHREKTPSFHVDAESRFFYCFGCGAGGDVITFVMKHQNLPFGDALKYLADRYNVSLPERDEGRRVYGEAAEEIQRERRRLYDVLSAAADFFYHQLHHERSGKVAREYILRRGLPEGVVETERLGYAPAQWDALLLHLKRGGTDPEMGVKAGLLAQSSKDGERFYDRFRNRLIFPIRDDQGRVVAFGGRSLSTETNDEPKYLNSPETPVYHKGRMLYQAARAREACRQSRQAVLVEGYMDLLAFHAQGFHRVVATLGTALTSHQVRLLARMCDEVVLAYDADEAGEKAMLRGLPLFQQEELTVSMVRFPQGMDPDDFLRAHGVDAFHSLLRDRQDLGAFAVSKALDAWDGSAVGKSRVVDDLQPLFASVRKPVLISEYARLVSDRLSLSEEVVLSQLRRDARRTAANYSGARPAVVQRTVSETRSLEEKIVGLMVRYPDLIEDVKSAGAVDFFREEKLKAVAEVLVNAPDSPVGEFDASSAYDLLPDAESKALFTRFLMEETELAEPSIQMRDWIEALTGRRERQKRLDLDEDLRRAEKEGDAVQVMKVLAQIQELKSAEKRLMK